MKLPGLRSCGVSTVYLGDGSVSQRATGIKHILVAMGLDLFVQIQHKIWTFLWTPPHLISVTCVAWSRKVKRQNISSKWARVKGAKLFTPSFVPCSQPIRLHLQNVVSKLLRLLVSKIPLPQHIILSRSRRNFWSRRPVPQVVCGLEFKLGKYFHEKVKMGGAGVMW